MDYKKFHAQYLEEGCIKIENFLTSAEVEELRKGVSEAVKNMPEENSPVFSVYGAGKSRHPLPAPPSCRPASRCCSSYENRLQAADEYYLSSGDKIGYFFENDAFDMNGKLIVEKKEALNKIGYALHWWNPFFKKHTFSQKIKDLLRNFQYKDPVIVQSMIIFKKPKIGEIVRPHQDSTFLYTEPPTCIGLWFPLEDATLENGCLWFVPGSHKEEIHQRFVRNPTEDPLLIMKGKVPDYADEEYVSVPAKKGDCVIIHGSVVHKSGRNTTKVARTVYTYHLVEKEAEWSKENWCQPTERLPFPSIYHN